MRVQAKNNFAMENLRWLLLHHNITFSKLCKIEHFSYLWLCVMFPFFANSDERDPFNRQPLRLEEVVPCKDLENRIKDWMKENNVKNFMHTTEDYAV